MIRYGPVRLDYSLGSFRDVPAEWWRPLVGTDATGAVAKASGAHALATALRNVGGRGSVVIPAYTCDRVVSAVLAAGDIPVFVDVDEASGAFQADELRCALEGHAKAVIATPFFGLDPSREKVLALSRQYGASVIEDRALLIGVVGTRPSLPDYAIYSLGRGKPASLGFGGVLASYGTASVDSAGDQGSTFGAISKSIAGLLKNSSLALRVSEVAGRFRGSQSGGRPASDGCEPLERIQTGRLFQKAVESFVNAIDVGKLSSQMNQSLGRYRDAFRAAGMQQLANSIGSRLPGGMVSPALALRVPNRNAAVSALRRSGIDVPVYWQESVAHSWTGEAFPCAQRLAGCLLYLPLHAGVGQEEAGRAASILRDYDPASFS